MSSSNCCFLACIQILQETSKVVWYSHLFKNFPQFVVIYTIKGFGIVNKAEVNVFLELSCFFSDQTDVGITAAAAAKSRQSCLTLCDPIDGSPPGSPVPGILQARILEWVVISLSSPWKWKVKVKSPAEAKDFSPVKLRNISLLAKSLLNAVKVLTILLLVHLSKVL